MTDNQQPTTVSKLPPGFRQFAELARELIDLHAQKALTQAQLIRWCVGKLRQDPSSARLRGFETYGERMRIIKENHKHREAALLYLEWLATGLEDQGVRLPDTIEQKDQ